MRTRVIFKLVKQKIKILGKVLTEGGSEFLILKFDLFGGFNFLKIFSLDLFYCNIFELLHVEEGIQYSIASWCFFLPWFMPQSVEDFFRFKAFKFVYLSIFQVFRLELFLKPIFLDPLNFFGVCGYTIKRIVIFYLTIFQRSAIQIYHFRFRLISSGSFNDVIELLGIRLVICKCRTYKTSILIIIKFLDTFFGFDLLLFQLLDEFFQSILLQTFFWEAFIFYQFQK